MIVLSKLADLRPDNDVSAICRSQDIARITRSCQPGDIFCEFNRGVVSRGVRAAMRIRGRKVYTSHNAPVYKDANNILSVLNCHSPKCESVPVAAHIWNLVDTKARWVIVRLAWRQEQRRSPVWDAWVSKYLSSKEGTDYPELDIARLTLLSFLPFMGRWIKNPVEKAYCSEACIGGIRAAGHLVAVPDSLNGKFNSPYTIEEAIRAGDLVVVATSTEKFKKKITG